MKYIKISFIATFFAFIALIGVLTLGNNRQISELEARTLETFKAPDVKGLLNGTWEKQTDTAFSDQLEFRDFFVSAYYKITFKSYTGDVVQGEGNHLFTAEQKIDDWADYEAKLIKSAEAINKTADELAKNGTKFIFVSIPRKDAVLCDALPEYYTSSDEIYIKAMDVLCSNFNENVIVIDAYTLFNTLPDKGESCYFTTDHHITVNGGMVIYDSIMEQMKNDGFEVLPLTIEDYNVQNVTINGSFNRLLGNSVSAPPEPLLISLKNQDFEYSRKENGKNSSKAIWGKNTNTYAGAYMDDDNEETIVTTSNTEYPNVLITGSSFTNILEALMVPSCHTMASIDYRYNETNKTLIEYAKEAEADYVLFVPSQSNDALSNYAINTHLGK